ncbi:helix-turn-helix domain-containing protein [Salinispora arenicola]|uniref:helix-turn-helix domain-containing protein n=1 Tax=Salinispora arenicola TaxID=168697 RepID=UPI0003A322EC|nr:helix-turn-helix domain-containing protein [Salinispora arenicola]
MSTDIDTTAAALDRLQRAREQRDVLAPLGRVLADIDEEARAAALAASAAGLSERAIAARLGVTQPTVHSWLDERRTPPTPPRPVAAQAWTLHHLASALASQVARLRGYRLTDSAPSSAHIAPTVAVRKAYTSGREVADSLAGLAGALDYANAEQVG